MGIEKVLRIFLPHSLLTSSSGVLYGTLSENETLMCITYLASHRSDPMCPSSDEVIPLGLWKNTYIDQLIDVYDFPELDTFQSRVKNTCLLLDKQTAGLPKCTVIEPCGKTSYTSTMIIVYDAQRYHKSYYLNDQAYCALEEMNDADLNSNRKTNLKQVAQSIVLSHKVEKSKTVVVDLVAPENGLMHAAETTLEHVIYWLLKFFHVFTQTIFNNRLFNNRWIHNQTFVPSACCQLIRRCLNISSEILKRNGTPKQQLRYNNCVSVILLDMVLGILLMAWLLYDEKNKMLAESIMVWADHIVSNLQELLQWLMGVPAGLKLNSQLDQLLGRFFQYHIYLWTGYLQVLRPVLADVLWYISLMGCLGISVQLCLIQDLISMMTLHIYCFYVYAARLYSLQISALGSLWRLFRGKKWNVLRKRVDSATYDVDQLFIGTLLFTILLFLLPTTALYYVVFTVLRLFVLGVQGCLHKIVMAINLIPMYSLLMRTVNADFVSDNVMFTILGKGPCDTLYLAMQMLPASIATILTCDKANIADEPADSCAEFIKKLCVGKLIYPWIEPKASP